MITFKQQEVLQQLKGHKIWDASYMEKVLKEKWPDATGYSWSVAALDREDKVIRITLFAHTPDQRWCFISKRLGERNPIEFSNKPAEKKNQNKK